MSYTYLITLGSENVFQILMIFNSSITEQQLFFAFIPLHIVISLGLSSSSRPSNSKLFKSLLLHFGSLSLSSSFFGSFFLSESSAKLKIKKKLSIKIFITAIFKLLIRIFKKVKILKIFNYFLNGVWGLGFGVWGLGFGGLGFGVWGTRGL